MAENNKELVEHNGNQLPSAVLDSKQYGIDMGEEDLVMPRLVLVQPTSKIEGAGKFYYTLTQELLDEVECVVFSNVRGRVMFDPDLSKQMSICGSNDRSIPSPRFEEPKAKACIECDYHRREYFEEVVIGGKKVKQMCQETQTIKAMFVDSLMPFLFVGRKTSLMPINTFLSEMQFECAKNKRGLHCFPIKITSKMISKVNQKYYIPVITKLGMIEKAEFNNMMQKYSNYDVDKTYAAEENTGNKPVVDEEGTPF